MTDLIHEHPKTEQPAPSAPAEPELDEKTGQKRVYGYIFLLFIVAFSLLVWSFFMNQRGTDRVLSELRGSTDALQTTLERNVELEERVEELDGTIDAMADEQKKLEEELARLKEEATEEKQRADARGLLWLLEYRFARGDYDRCRETAAELEEFRDALQTEGSAACPSELARYEEILAALAEQVG